MRDCERSKAESCAEGFCLCCPLRSKGPTGNSALMLRCSPILETVPQPETDSCRCRQACSPGNSGTGHFNGMVPLPRCQPWRSTWRTREGALPVETAAGHKDGVMDHGFSKAPLLWCPRSSLVRLRAHRVHRERLEGRRRGEGCSGLGS